MGRGAVTFAFDLQVQFPHLSEKKGLRTAYGNFIRSFTVCCAANGSFSDFRLVPTTFGPIEGCCMGEATVFSGHIFTQFPPSRGFVKANDTRSFCFFCSPSPVFSSRVPAFVQMMTGANQRRRGTECPQRELNPIACA